MSPNDKGTVGLVPHLRRSASSSIDTQPFPLLPPWAALEGVASAVFFTENRIECNAPTSTTGKQGTGWADVWRSALQALHPWRFLPCHFPSTCRRQVSCSGWQFMFLGAFYQGPPGAPCPGFPIGLGEVSALHAAFLNRKPHTRPLLVPRSRKSGSFALFAKGGIRRG